MAEIAGSGSHRTVGLPWKQSRLPVQYPGFSEQSAGKQLQVEAQLSLERLRHCLVQFHIDDNRVSFAPHCHPVIQLHIRIDHRVQAAQVLLFVGIAELCHDGVGLRVQPAGKLLRHRLPLAGRGLKAHIPAGGDAPSVHQDTDAGLVPLGIDVVKGHHVDAFVAKIPSPHIQSEPMVSIIHTGILPHKRPYPRLPPFTSGQTDSFGGFPWLMFMVLLRIVLIS